MLKKSPVFNFKFDYWEALVVPGADLGNPYLSTVVCSTG